MLRSFMSSSMRRRSGVMGCVGAMEASCGSDCRNPAILTEGDRGSAAAAEREMISGNPEGAGLNPAYPLGHSDRELERLSAQARLVGPFTRRIFRKAGIGPGMRVLDVGSGNGEVA